MGSMIGLRKGPMKGSMKGSMIGLRKAPMNVAMDDARGIKTCTAIYMKMQGDDS
jgi:hypothetical protein